MSMPQSRMPWLRRFPNTAIGLVLGPGGHSILWYNLAVTPFTRDVLGDVALVVNWFFWCVGVAGLTCFMLLFAVKAAVHRDVVAAEFAHPVRSHFFNGPHIAVLMLALSAPREVRNVQVQHAVWVVAAVLQAVLTNTFYSRWLFSEKATLSEARPPYLLSTIGWLLLAVLGNGTQLEQAWHLPLPEWVFGIGVATYAFVVIAVFLNIKNAPGEQGQPALFLLIAPSSVAALALVGFNGGIFGTASSALLGYNYMVIAVLLKLGPQFLEKPKVLGTYWAYVFPLAAFATAGVKQAASGSPDGEESVPAQVVAWILVIAATLMLVLVFLRMSWHHALVLQGKETWPCPVAAACDAKLNSFAAMALEGVGAGSDESKSSTVIDGLA